MKITEKEIQEEIKKLLDKNENDYYKILTLRKINIDDSTITLENLFSIIEENKKIYDINFKLSTIRVQYRAWGEELEIELQRYETAEETNERYRKTSIKNIKHENEQKKNELKTLDRLKKKYESKK